MVIRIRAMRRLSSRVVPLSRRRCVVPVARHVACGPPGSPSCCLSRLVVGSSGRSVRRVADDLSAVEQAFG